MKGAYTIVLIPNHSGGYTVNIPAFKNWTEGDDLYDAIYMAKDAIGLLGVTYEDDGKVLPEDCEPEEEYRGYKTALVDVDFDAYRRKLEHRAVHKNVTIPAWLEVEARKKKVNFSQVMQEALMQIVNG